MIYGLATGLAYTGFILVLRAGSGEQRRVAGPLFDATLVAAVVVASSAGLLIGDADLVPTWPAHAWLVMLALTSQVLGWLLISASLPRLPAALTSLLLTIQPVGSVVLGVAALRRGAVGAAARRRRPRSWSGSSWSRACVRRRPRGSERIRACDAARVH